MFKVYHSNRLEQLLAHLLQLLSTPLENPLAAETIVTQHQGMARWLSLQLASHQGIVANLRYPFPASYIWELYRSQLPQVPETSHFDRSILTWAIMDELPKQLADARFLPLKHYLQGGQDQLKQYQLARYLADTFEQYLIYRPDWILAWERGTNLGCEKQPWQAALWRALASQQDKPPLHRAALHRQFMVLAQTNKLDPQTLPQRITVFGISTLPPAYLEVLAALARQVEVHLFTLNPCLAFWEDITDHKTLARLRQLWQRQGKPDVSQYYEVGNSLLASMGKQGRDFQRLLHQQETPPEDEDCAVFPQEQNLLECIHSDVLQLLERGQGDYQPTTIAADDRSIRIHSCHSTMREVQVLYDQLLAMFETDPTLQPRDVIVMTPEIDTCAPYIEAVFGSAPESRRIPWSIADRSAQAEHPLLNTVLQMLQLPGARFEASEVLAMLEVPAVHRAYQLDEQALLRIRQWIQESGIRWGLDAQARSELGQPAEDAFSWRFGLERMMLGYAMPAEEQIYGDRVPYPHIEGIEAQWLGKLHRFIDDLARLRQLLARPHRPQRWQQLVNDLLERFQVEQDDERQALQLLREVMDGLRQYTEQAGYRQAISLEVVQDYLRGHLISPAAPHRFLAGQVSFCAMMPMRSLPFKVVCMIGMNDNSYPRTRPPLGFDLMVDRPRVGDRSRRDDDRYLFLEALLSARQQFYISYVGRSIRDNALLLPSVLVSELTDYIEQGFCREDQTPILQQLITEHPLQPFSPRYFQAQQGLFSYADEWLAASRQVSAADSEEQPFVDQPLAEPEPERRSIDLLELVRFFNNPCRHFMQQRLGIRLAIDEEPLEDSEPFALDSLQVYQLKQQLVEQALQDADLAAYYLLQQGKGELPVGAFGQLEYQQYGQQATEFADTLKPHLQQPLEPLEVDLTLGEFTLHGWLHGLTPQGLVRYRHTKLKAKDRLALWINHLALCCVQPAGVACRSLHLAEDKQFSLDPVVDAKHQLHQLLEYYWQGLSAPLPFYPETSFTYAETCQQGSQDKALGKALKTFEGSDYYAGEGGDDYVQLARRGRHPLDQQFSQLARQIFEPLLAAQQEGD